MARVLNQSQAARAVVHRKKQKERKKKRKIAERKATGILETLSFSFLLAAMLFSALSLALTADLSTTDPSYKPGAAQAEMRMFRRRKQLRRWFHDLIERDDPRRPKFAHDVVAFNKLTKLRTDEELIEQLKGDDTSPVVKDLFDRVFIERAKAAGVDEEGNMDVEVKDWWGIGPEMEQPGEVVGGEEISDENGGEGEGGEDGGECMTGKNMDKPRSSSTSYLSEQQSS